MAVRRRRRGFEHAGSCPASQLGIPAARARELELATAWIEVAGRALAARVESVRVQRGTLEIRVDDQRWAETIETLLPRLAGRLARRCPSLAIRRARLLVAEGSGETVRRGPAVALQLEEEGHEALDGLPARAVAAQRSAREEPEEDLARRLSGVAERYLARADGRRVRTRIAPDRGKPSDPS